MALRLLWTALSCSFGLRVRISPKSNVEVCMQVILHEVVMMMLQCYNEEDEEI